MGSTALQRGGHRVVAYDARGHGASEPAPLPSEYEYADLAQALLGVLEGGGIGRAALAGGSGGAHTALRVAIEERARVAGLVVVPPAYDPDDMETPGRLERWD